MHTTESLLPLPEVETIVGIKKSKIYALINEGGFPSPIRIGRRAVRWRLGELQSWIENLPSAAATKEANA